MTTSWLPGIPAPSDDDLNKCVSCGLCLPHCPTFRVTGLETASPRGRIAAMRAVSEGLVPVTGEFSIPSWCWAGTLGVVVALLLMVQP